MPAAAAPVGCAISFSDELEGFSFFFSFTFDFLLFGRSYSRDRGKKQWHRSEHLSDTFQHVSRVGDQLQLGHTASQGTTLSSEHDALFSTGIPTQTSFSFPAAFVVLLLSSLSLPPTDVFSSLLQVILPSSSSIGCFTSPRKELTPVT